MPKDTWKVSMGVFGPQGKLLPKLTFINWSPNRQVVHYMTEMYLTQGWVDDLFEVTLPAQIDIEAEYAGRVAYADRRACHAFITDYKAAIERMEELS